MTPREAELFDAAARARRHSTEMESKWNQAVGEVIALRDALQQVQMVLMKKDAPNVVLLDQIRRIVFAKR